MRLKRTDVASCMLGYPLETEGERGMKLIARSERVAGSGASPSREATQASGGNPVAIPPCRSSLSNPSQSNSTAQPHHSTPHPRLLLTEMPSIAPPPATNRNGIQAYFTTKIEAAELLINSKTQNLRRLEAQRNALNARG